MKNCPGSWNGVIAVEKVEEHDNKAGRACERMGRRLRPDLPNLEIRLSGAVRYSRRG
jgi:hypothetical protein